MARLQLPNVTAVSVSGISTVGAVKSLELSMRGIDFHQALVISHKPPETSNPRITFKQCLPTDLQSQDRTNTDDYSKFLLFRLADFIETDYALIVHNDAYVIRPHRWTNEFLKYDYIGPPWAPNVHFTPSGKNVRVGNGGFSLRSKKMLNALNDLHLPFTDGGTGFFHEDGILCVYHRDALETAGLKFAPVELASLFGLEQDCPDSHPTPFGFHNNRNALPTLARWKQHVIDYKRLRKQIQAQKK